MYEKERQKREPTCLSEMGVINSISRQKPLQPDCERQHLKGYGSDTANPWVIAQKQHLPPDSGLPGGSRILTETFVIVRDHASPRSVFAEENCGSGLAVGSLKAPEKCTSGV